MAFTPEEEKYLKALYAHFKAGKDYQEKVEVYTLYRSQLDDAKDPKMIEKSKPMEDEAKALIPLIEEAKENLKNGG